METTIWQKQRAITKLSQLAANAEFAQLVRLAKRVAKTYDLSMHYGVSPQLAFPVSDIADIALEKVGQTETLTILVRFMGLIGTSGSLPEHYTEYLLQRLQEKDSTLLAFLDLFHTQLFALYYRTQNLSHFYIAEEEGEAHPVPQLLNAISGQADTDAFDWQRYFSGILGMQARSQKGLEQILQTHFQLPITVETYTPVWLRVDENDVSRLSKENHHLSRTAMLGKRFTSVQDRFTLHISVLNYAQFEQCLPGSALLTALNKIVKAYCGLVYEFDIKLSISQSSLPCTVLSAKKQSHLGWNSTLPLRKIRDIKRVIKISVNQCQKVA